MYLKPKSMELETDGMREMRKKKEFKMTPWFGQ